MIYVGKETNCLFGFSLSTFVMWSFKMLIGVDEISFGVLNLKS